ncbi:hypothetical protein I3760_13G027200 [Carya illinoinensis]|uniref:Uncharacterized protein n=1 Tax=Carya illinoinensis TaxID=32201 RepID=A0A922ALG2_CARIL|nr:hypothetical protein I3760_13G027200 [Carya illinoinensis]KAG6680175.1 hypothetical protein I3842_13G028300 [Carya illinoinensis]
MAKMAGPAAADSDPIGKELDECKELLIDIPLALEPPLWPECCIYRVPKRLREINEKAYTPRLVSIGPFHHRREELRNMEMQKLRYLRDFCYRTRTSHEDLAANIQRSEVKIRRCYSETFELSSEEFVKMILLDAVFIIELFLRKSEILTEHKDHILHQPCMERGIRSDLILLENQLPFFVLENLFTLVPKPQVSSGCKNHKEGQQTEELKEGLSKNVFSSSFRDLSCQFFESYGKPPESSSIREVKHFTDLVRNFFFPPTKLTPNSPPPNQRVSESRSSIQCLYTATKLGEAALKFRPARERSLLEITFPENKCLENCPCFNLSWLISCLPCLKTTFLAKMQRFLEVPPFLVDDKTEGLFRNLMALEQCHYPSQTFICDYVVLLDNLITTKKDVSLLVEKKVIANELGSNAAVTDLINKLGLEIEENATFYSELTRKLNGYYENPWNRLVATLTSVYFHDFWRGTATVIGLVVLALTMWNFIRLVSRSR